MFLASQYAACECSVIPEAHLSILQLNLAKYEKYVLGPFAYSRSSCSVAAKDRVFVGEHEAGDIAIDGSCRERLPLFNTITAN